MQWDVPYRVSRSLTFEIPSTGRLAARSSISRPLQDMDLDALPVLLAFSAGSTPREALVRLSAEWDLEEEGFATVVCFRDGRKLRPEAASEKWIQKSKKGAVRIEILQGVGPAAPNAAGRAGLD